MQWWAKRGITKNDHGSNLFQFHLRTFMFGVVFASFLSLSTVALALVQQKDKTHHCQKIWTFVMKFRLIGHARHCEIVWNPKILYTKEKFSEKNKSLSEQLRMKVRRSRLWRRAKFLFFHGMQNQVFLPFGVAQVGTTACSQLCWACNILMRLRGCRYLQQQQLGTD